MNIKNLFMSVMVLAMTLGTADCFAQVSKSDLNIGGIYYGQPWSEVIATYGQPVRREKRPPAGHNNIFSYSNFEFIANPAKNEYVDSVLIKDNCTFATKAGIHIGSTLAEVKAAYGEPDYSYGGKNVMVLEYGTGWESVELDNEFSMDFEPRLAFSFDSAAQSVKSIYFIVAEDEIAYRTGSRPPRSSQQKPSVPQGQPRQKSTIPAFVTQIPVSELNLGWIEPGQPMKKAEDVYGKPGIIDDQGFFQIYNYNDKFIVKGKMNNGYKVTSVASYEKGMKTPSGFMVGDAYSAVVKKFGPVNGIKFKGEGVEAKLKGCTDYTYFSGNKQMVFLVDKKGIIQGIRVEELDEQKFIEAKRKKS